MIAMIRTYERLFSGDLESSRALAAAAIELGNAHDVMPAVVVGSVAQARLLVLDGDVEAGLRALDDAGAQLLAGTVDPLTTGMMLCEVICAAQGLAMPDLARDWTDHMERWRGGAAAGGFHGRCRVHHAELLRLTGPCDAAEAAALTACAELRPWMRREYGWPLVELGNIRLRKGDLAGAEDAFLAAEGIAWSAQPGLALLRLAQGDPATAAALIADAIANPADIPWKERPPLGELRNAPLLDAQAKIAAARGDLSTCETAAGELVRIAGRFPSRGLDATASLAQARAALLRGEFDVARKHAQHAVAVCADLDAVFDAAVARVVAGDALAAEGSADAARIEWDAARRAFTDYGAAAHADEVQARLSGAPTTTAPADVASSARFERRAQTRLIAFAGRECTLPDLVGFRYIEHLLRAPGREIAATDLVGAEQPGAEIDQLGLPAIDEQARDAYRRRLAEIEDDIAEATAHNDLARAELAGRDRDFLVAELSRAVGLGGRMRTVGGSAERARTSVFRAIRYAIERIAQAEPTLAAHLRRSIRTGTMCCYQPDPLAPMRWEL
jgi:tetratricopeptide (TPR) repeat protein